MAIRDSIHQFLAETSHNAGRLLLRHYGRVRNIRQKGPKSSVVCEADLASEKYIIREIRRVFPGDGIIGEESGRSKHAPLSNGRTWVIDPLDGTSNFVAGVPWFGVQFGLLENAVPVCAAMYLPVDGVLYVGSRGHGTWRNGKRLQMRGSSDPSKRLCAFGFDPAATRADRRRLMRTLLRVAEGVRNTRATNSLLDFCYTLDGRFGGCINFNCKIWDIVSATLLFGEAGGKFTDLTGQTINFRHGQTDLDHRYGIVGAQSDLHPKLLRLMRVE